MKHPTDRWKIAIGAAAGALLLGVSITSHAVDADGAKELARQNNCFKCHGITKKKDGPAYKDVATKYRGNPNAEAKLIHHLTSGEQVKFPDGHSEPHKIVKDASPADLKNLVDWILAQ
jgi:cytochrome c